MFGNDKHRSPEQMRSKNCRFSLLASDLTIKGNIDSGADLHVDGRIEGDVQCTGLTQGSESQIVGNVTADSVKLAGTVEGSVKARSVTIEPSARITGDVEYEVIRVETGGKVDGNLKPTSAGADAGQVKEADKAGSNVRSIAAVGEM